jgi:hypothetical protein
VYGKALEMVRISPSASNRQPWRVVQRGRVWHFYLRRTPGYPPGIAKSLFNLADLQRIDMGIAMSHFALPLLESGVSGSWTNADPGIRIPREDRAYAEYTATWKPS